ncbi:MAG: SEC-C domain-containing protein [Tyzzerella sp.]|uniref:SEC-C domain-containing protein n=1 Tax=Candidatus Fimicola merdigallinarum TaxID=2840819 RepID=A0A9D9DZX0_9FIRM|nr:SEC-C domain-containing protein [Candidatus Fimicola merdigallinarum]
MTLYQNWMSRAFTKEGRSVDAVWDQYLPREQRIYEYIIGEKVTTLEGKVAELAAKFNMTAEEIVAFVDGINEVIPESYDLNTLEENSDVKLVIDFEKLFKKMVEYKAEHLYTLPQWEGIFDAKKRHELTLQQKKSRTIVKATKVGRNDPCPCGSGKKYKKCCGA